MVEPSTVRHEAHRGDSGFAEANAGLQPAAVLKPDRDNDTSVIRGPAIFNLATDAKHKSNLKDYCKKHRIKHDPHIPESDCAATFEVYKKLMSEHGENFIMKYVTKK